ELTYRRWVFRFAKNSTQFGRNHPVRLSDWFYTFSCYLFT
ncbi:hypothetical protein D1AOALGA4SA_472, partial [Olavius algarvensis Delta 1 endosymbiont]